MKNTPDKYSVTFPGVGHIYTFDNFNSLIDWYENQIGELLGEIRLLYKRLDERQ